MADIEITDVDVKDIRFPTSLLSDGSDAMVKKALIFVLNKSTVF